MAAYQPKSTEVDFNGTTEVTLVSGSGSAPRVAHTITVKNEDTIPHGIKIRKKKASAYTTLVEVPNTAPVPPGGFFPPVPITGLDAADESIVGELTEVNSGTQPRADVFYLEYA